VLPGLRKVVQRGLVASDPEQLGGEAGQQQPRAGHGVDVPVQDAQADGPQAGVAEGNTVVSG
jgi:hypothetical protein